MDTNDPRQTGDNFFNVQIGEDDDEKTFFFEKSHMKLNFKTFFEVLS